ncbi:MAG TPA: hypothetical protein VIL20_06210, partial [Sandaracinaceae bacterium]
ALRRRLAELSSELIDRVESVARPGRWSEEVVLALHDEIVDPFEGEPQTGLREDRRRRTTAGQGSAVVRITSPCPVLLLA